MERRRRSGPDINLQYFETAHLMVTDCRYVVYAAPTGGLFELEVTREKGEKRGCVCGGGAY